MRDDPEDIHGDITRFRRRGQLRQRSHGDILGAAGFRRGCRADARVRPPSKEQRSTAPQAS
eukprot:3777400-Pyramimonas_sp.AAC.1